MDGRHAIARPRFGLNYYPKTLSDCENTKEFSTLHILKILNNFYRAIHISAKRFLAIACRPSVRLSVCLSVRLLIYKGLT